MLSLSSKSKYETVIWFRGSQTGSTSCLKVLKRWRWPRCIVTSVCISYQPNHTNHTCLGRLLLLNQIIFTPTPHITVMWKMRDNSLNKSYYRPAFGDILYHKKYLTNSNQIRYIKLSQNLYLKMDGIRSQPGLLPI